MRFRPQGSARESGLFADDPVPASQAAMPPDRRLLAVLLLELDQQFAEDEARVAAQLSRRRQKRRDLFLQVLAQASKAASKPGHRKVDGVLRVAGRRPRSTVQ